MSDGTGSFDMDDESSGVGEWFGSTSFNSQLEDLQMGLSTGGIGTAEDIGTAECIGKAGDIGTAALSELDVMSCSFCFEIGTSPES